MTTLAELITEIQADTDRTSAANRTAMLNKVSAAIRHYKSHRFFFNETRSVTFNTVVGQDTYSFASATNATPDITTEFYKIDGVWITIAANDVRELDVSDYADLEYDADNFTTTGQPTDYAFINKALRIYPAPDAIYSVRIAGFYNAPEPVDEADDTNVWVNEAYDLIMSRAKAELYAHRWEDPNNASIMQQAEASALRVLEDATADKLRTGYVQASEF